MLVEMTEAEKKNWDKYNKWTTWTPVMYMALYEMYGGVISEDECSDAIRPLIDYLDDKHGFTCNDAGEWGQWEVEEDNEEEEE